MSTEIKKKIQEAIRQFKSSNLSKNAIALFNCLGYNTDRQSPLSKPTFDAFKDSFISDDRRFNEEKACVKSWRHVDLLFQLSKDELSFDPVLFEKKVVTKLPDGKEDKTIIETYLFFAIELNPGTYSRTVFSQITREVNKLFPMPVMILFKVDSSLTLSVINRRLHKRDENKDVLEKVTLIKDISIENPHRAHIEILFDLSFAELLRIHNFTNFVELHNAWQKTLDTKELNKRFYQELSNWYFWAKDKVSFPADVEKNEEKRNSINLIRLITRIIFIWFIKEKNLVPEDLFDRKKLQVWLKDFNRSAKSSSFYTAILQNLFFGTLNQKMEDRAFVKDGTFEDNRDEYGVKNLFRYADQFAVSEKEALALFADIPFLNGGLFDCLDKPDDSGKILYCDGFSRNPKKRAFVPDYLFYSGVQDCDLNEIYGTWNKRYQVKGLIEILSSYKFTIAENTPLEEEVALDPELLGKVFENLLASYNPETQTTARKQTGSFYTPREIVDYMVDESLIAYFKSHLASSCSPPDKEGWPKAGVVSSSINNLPYLKTFRRELRNNLTPAEAKLWTYLQGSQLDGRKFRRQHSIANYILDFYCPEEAIAIELDGEVHNNPEAAEYDRERDLFLEATGISVLRFENRVVFENPDYLLGEVRKWFGWKEKTKTTTPSACGGHPSLSGGELLEKNLRDLLSYVCENVDFDEEEKECLINAIDSCKILDPACGSGAFPMGILHKLVNVLHKLDPDNMRWRELQRKKAIKETEDAYKLGDKKERERRLLEINDIFENNSDEYGRKLYLIENCIFGVDIQPIAVQIAKLRFFISLIIDQNKRLEKDNFNIRSLPNLETKFVAADTLIGLQQQGVLRDVEVEELEAELKTIRHDYFSARTRKDKLHFQKKDKLLRQKIATLLQKSGWNSATALQVARFDPYDQNTSADFFDFEWMFGLKPADGSSGIFDIVIGNPPYIQIQNFSGMKQQKDWERQKYATYVKTGDVYCLFYERGYQLLKNGGVLTFITSNKWMRANYGKVMRRFFNTNGSILRLIDFGDSPIFENATTYTNILVWKKDKEAGKEKTKAWDLSKVYTSDTSLEEMLQKQGECDALFSDDTYVVVKEDQTAVKRRIEQVGTPLKEWDVSIYRGILTGLNEAFIINGKKKDDLIQEDPKSAEILKPILRGRDIKRYKAEFADLWLIASHNGYKDENGNVVQPVNVKRDYPAVYKYLHSVGKSIEKGEIKVKGKGLFNRDDQGKDWWNLRDCAYYREFEKEKLFWLEMSPGSNFSFDNRGYFVLNTAYILTGNPVKYLVAVINSKILDYYFPMISTDVQGQTRRYIKQYVENLPIPRIPPSQQLPFEILVDCILFCKERSMESEASLFESVIDGLVFDLYFPDEMKAAHCYITDRIAPVLKPFKKSDTVAFKTEYIKTLETFITKDGTISHSLVHRHLVKPVQIILGKS